MGGFLSNLGHLAIVVERSFDKRMIARIGCPFLAVVILLLVVILIKILVFRSVLHMVTQYAFVGFSKMFRLLGYLRREIIC